MNATCHLLASLCLGLGLAQPAAAATDATVRVELSKLHNTRGDIGCLLFNAADGYPEVHAKAHREIHVPIDGDRAVCEFKGLMAGTYAVIAFHDENLNGKLDKNFVGMPQEGYGASKNVRPRLSAPAFQDASFPAGADAVTTLSIQIGY
jgi:uncharacterized protein (DUF2141 family)